MKTTVNAVVSRRPKWSPGFYWWIIIALWFYLGAVAYPVTHWIDLRSVTVHDAPTAMEVTLDVDVTVQRPFYGDYEVTIRRWPGGQFVCTAGPLRPFQYTTGTQRPDPTYLWWWLGEPADISRCETNGLRPGAYTIKTCHDVINPFLGLVPDKRRCVESNVFRIGGDR